MSGLARIERATGASARALALVGALALGVLMVLLTVVDVVLRQFGEAIPGAFDLVTLGMRILVPLALPYTFWRGGHVAVNLIADRLPIRAKAALVSATLVASGVAMAVLVYVSWWRMGGTAHDVSPDLGIPFPVYWWPIVIGTALCLPVLAVMLARQIAIVMHGEAGRSPVAPDPDAGRPA